MPRGSVLDVEQQLAQAKQEKGETLFEMILAITRGQSHVELVLG